MFDTCANGQQIKCLTVIDEFTGECLAIDVAGSIRTGRVLEILTRTISERGAPRFLGSDNGPEFSGYAILGWLADSGMEATHIDLDKPWRNGVDKSHKCMIACCSELPELVAYFRKIADEGLFPTLIVRNGPRKVLGLNHYLEWGGRWTGPDELTIEDLVALAGSRKFFARKFPRDPNSDIRRLDLDLASGIAIVSPAI